eukprot:3437602-Ditylum_brightwellii.AAC.1
MPIILQQASILSCFDVLEETLRLEEDPSTVKLCLEGFGDEYIFERLQKGAMKDSISELDFEIL